MKPKKERPIPTTKQMAAIRYTLEKSEELQRIYPEIADDYRNGLTHLEISRKYNLNQIFSTSGDVISISIVRYALVGNSNEHLGPIFDGLILEEDYSDLSKDHQAENARANSLESRLTNKGIFGLTSDERRETGQRVGKRLYLEKKGMFARTPEEILEGARKAARRCYELKRGVHSLTFEQRSAYGKIGGAIGGKIAAITNRERGTGLFALTFEQRSQNAKRSVIKRGLVPWESEEIHLALELSKQEDFRYKGRVWTKKIAEELNRKYHNEKEIRTSDAVGIMIGKKSN